MCVRSGRDRYRAAGGVMPSHAQLHLALRGKGQFCMPAITQWDFESSL